ncbi:MAG: hypothetical protein KGY66_00245 [Candidatus Thermoplasmatota archaeon]|nr:hypothetical protein [Candidatus Thermoplasmatota archaeon]MBS3789333.1 hypothetical protein [Candidatus Thermoplasmatota archaeon]
MKIILDENLPSKVKEDIEDMQDCDNILDVNERYKGILDFELVDKMKDDDIMVTRDIELHENLLNMGKKSVYYDIQEGNLTEVQIKLAHYLKGHGLETVNKELEENDHVPKGINSQLRKRFEELKKENARLKSRVNLLEGKLKSVLKSAESALDEE